MDYKLFSKNKIILLLIFNIISIICTQESPSLAEIRNRTLSVNETKDTYNYTLPLRQQLVVKMRGNPSTGYGWYLDQLNPNGSNKIDKTVLKPTNLDQYNSGDFVIDPHPEGYVGVPGYFIFKFMPVKTANNVKIVFVYMRPWETDTPPDRTVTINLRIIR